MREKVETWKRHKPDGPKKPQNNVNFFRLSSFVPLNSGQYPKHKISGPETTFHRRAPHLQSIPSYTLFGLIPKDKGFGFFCGYPSPLPLHNLADETPTSTLGTQEVATRDPSPPGSYPPDTRNHLGTLYRPFTKTPQYGIYTGPKGYGGKPHLITLLRTRRLSPNLC